MRALPLISRGAVGASAASGALVACCAVGYGDHRAVGTRARPATVAAGRGSAQCEAFAQLHMSPLAGLGQIQLSEKSLPRIATMSAKERAALPILRCEAEEIPSWRPGWQFHAEYKIELGRELGCGGYGHVYLAVHKLSGVSRAVKRVRRASHDAEEALKKELEVMQRLKDCPHVVRVIDSFVDDTYRYMVMELCYGLDLVDSIVEELSGGDSPSNMLDFHPNLPHVAAVFREMVTAVAECHEKKVCHMDIKPENFIHMSTEAVNGGARVKLLDFGLAWADVESARISTGTHLGCSKYLAPELFKKGLGVEPEPCDMYALGVSLFNLLTGGFPFVFGRMGRPRTRADLSRLRDSAARDLVESLLSNDPANRPTTQEVLQHEFLQVHRDAQVEPLSDFKERSVKSFFLDASPSTLSGQPCACAVPAQCCHRAFARSINAGEVLFHEGDRSRAVYFITAGSFNVMRKGSLIGTLGSDSVVGEMGALFDRPRGATVVAAENAEVFEFKDFGEKLGSTQQRYALAGIQETALKGLQHDRTRDFLKKTTLFGEASEDLLNMIVAGSRHEFFSKGQKVLEEDDDKMCLYIVQDGLLEMRVADSKYVGFVGPGEIVGEMALVFGQRGRETLQALKPTTALVLDRSEFALILNGFPKEREIIVAMAEWRLQEMGLSTALTRAVTS